MGIVLAVLFGPIVWATHLLVIYGTHAEVCAVAGRGVSSTAPLTPVFATATALALVLAAVPLAFPQRLAGLLYRRRSEEEDLFLLSLMRWLGGLSLIAIAANGLALLMLPTC